MKIAMICRYDNSGLGTLSREFASWLRPHKVLLVSNGVYQTFPERYDEFNTKIVDPKGSIDGHLKEWITDDVDLLLTFETFYDWSLITHCRRKKMKSVLMTMCEMTPIQIPLHPDVFLCPSKLDYDMMPDPKEYMPVPVNIQKLQWRKRYNANTFIHTASHGGVSGRKGTALLIEAMRYVEKKIKLIIYSWQPMHTDDDRIEVHVVNFKDYWQVWREGDVLVYPQDYNGICLPIVEAMTCGLGVITTDMYPFNEYMPKRLLFNASSFQKVCASPRLMPVQGAKIDPQVLGAKIDEIAFQDIGDVSDYGRTWGQENSWEKLLPKYKKLFARLCQT